jgi:hypothetical protein
MKDKLFELQEVWTEERREAKKGVDKARKEADAYKASLQGADEILKKLQAELDPQLVDQVKSLLETNLQKAQE